MRIEFIHTSRIRLAYLEVNPQNERTVFFIHGNSGSSRTWRKQFDSNLFRDYRLIAFDLPGTGQSLIDNSTEWDYSPLAAGKVIAEAVKNLAGGKPYILVGFSYGTNVIGEALNHALSPAGIVLSAACTTGPGYELDKIFAAGDYIFFHDEVKTEDVRSFFSNTLVSQAEEDINVNTEDFFLAKPPFRSALIKSVMEGKISDEIALLKNHNIPIQVFFGLEDKMLQINYLDNIPFTIWRNSIHKLPGAGHYLQSDQPESFNRLLSVYLGERFTEFHA